MFQKEKNIPYIDEANIAEKTVLLCIDMDVALDADGNIIEDSRIEAALPTIDYLLEHNNTVLLVGKIGRPKWKKNPFFSTERLTPIFEKHFPQTNTVFLGDFEKAREQIQKLPKKSLAILENIRFHPEELTWDEAFAKKLAGIADIYVNDAFGTSHRKQASTYTVAKYLPSYAGFTYKKELPAINSILEKPAKTRIAIMGGAKLETKMRLVKMLQKMDYVLVGGVMANTFLKTLWYDIGESKYDPDELETAKEVLYFMAQHRSSLILPSDVIIWSPKDQTCDQGVFCVTDLPKGGNILDIGPKTCAIFGNIIAQADVIFWNGPVGYYENPRFQRGSDFIYHAITQNSTAHSVAWGGDTLAVLSGKTDLDAITHISSGWGAMLDLLAHGTLPALEVLKEHVQK